MAKSRICSIDGCGKPTDSRGWCHTHYVRWLKHGDPLLGARMTQPPCSVPECGRTSKARGLCSRHYHRWERHGDPLAGGTTRGEPARYLAQVVLPYAGDECLTWPYSRMKNGYANHTHEGRTVVLSRLVCNLVYGAPPTPRHEAAHSCGNGHLGCVNPRHLCWKTHTENEADKLIHGTRRRAG